MNVNRGKIQRQQFWRDASCCGRWVTGYGLHRAETVGQHFGDGRLKVDGQLLIPCMILPGR